MATVQSKPSLLGISIPGWVLGVSLLIGNLLVLRHNNHL